jgi:hypothetical protein
MAILEIANSENPTPDWGNYSPIFKKSILESLLSVKSGLELLDARDRANFVLPSKERIPFSIPENFNEQKIEDLLTQRVIPNKTREILKVKSPDFLGESQWKFQLDKIITARILDKKWLNDFQLGLELIHPGDSIEVMMTSKKKYDVDMNLIGESYEINEVIQIHRAKQYE